MELTQEEFTPIELAKQLNISEYTVRKAMKVGRLNYYKVGHNILISKESAQKYIDMYLQADGLTVNQIAEKAGVSRSTVCNALRSLNLILPVGYTFGVGPKASVYSRKDAERIESFIRSNKDKGPIHLSQ